MIGRFILVVFIIFLMGNEVVDIWKVNVWGVVFSVICIVVFILVIFRDVFVYVFVIMDYFILIVIDEGRLCCIECICYFG